MPLYEYQCQSCQHQFELLVREQTVLACPSCKSDDLVKQLSVFAVGAATTRSSLPMASAGPCGTCGDPRGPGACSMN
jgi:putative FmdB family regulatory protein